MKTIAAIASGRSTGGVGVIRLSGSKALAIAKVLCQQDLKPRYAHFVKFINNDQQVVDSGIALYFKAPHSFTGEDVVELQCHGGIMVMELLLQTCLEAGAELAEPGEFSRRAFLNDKMDLCQAEAVADLINAQSMQAVYAANQTLQGAFSRQINHIIEQLIKLRIFVEAAIDFPDEEIDFLQDSDIAQKVKLLTSELEVLLANSKQGTLLNEGKRVVIAGEPNVGKSSLLNILAGEDKALVTDVAGTTRDSIDTSIVIEGLPLQIIDTAGLHVTEDKVEQMGIARSWSQIEQANLLLYIVDASKKESQNEDLFNQLLQKMPASTPYIMVRNKSDLVDSVVEGQFNVSALTGMGLDALKQQIIQSIGYQVSAGFSARTRHCHAIEVALGSLQCASKQFIAGSGELLAEDLKQAHQSLGVITGAMTADELLGEIFSNFCIGK